MDSMRKHVMKMTKNLLVLQKAGMCCDVTMVCQDGNITAHSGNFLMRNVQKQVWQMGIERSNLLGILQLLDYFPLLTWLRLLNFPILLDACKAE